MRMLLATMARTLMMRKMWVMPRGTVVEEYLVSLVTRS